MIPVEPNSKLMLTRAKHQVPFPHAGSCTSDSTLSGLYWQWFESRPAETPHLLDVAFRLRYRVYCIENAFENPAACADGREKDEFDQHAAHSLLIYRPSMTPAGLVRLVLPSRGNLEGSFALQRVCTHPLLRDRSVFPTERMGEVSRFCISKEFRRRWDDGACVGGKSTVDGAEMSADEERRILPHLSLGLIESLVRMSVDHCITHWCAAMKPSLLRLLARLGIHFEPIGPLIEYHGRRQPCYSPLDVLLPRVRRERPDVWDVITHGGTLWVEVQRLIDGEPTRRAEAALSKASNRRRAVRRINADVATSAEKQTPTSERAWTSRVGCMASTCRLNSNLPFASR